MDVNLQLKNSLTVPSIKTPTSPELGWDLESVLASGRTSRPAMNGIRKWLRKDSYPELTDEQVAMFLLSCNNVQEATQKTIKAYYKVKRDAPGLFDNRDMSKNNDMEEIQKVAFFGVFPNRTPDGYPIAFHKLRDFTYWKYNLETAMKLLFMTFDITLIGKNPPNGFIMLLDMEGVGLMHLTRIRLNAVKHFFHYIQEGLPIQLKAIHVLNVVYFFDKIMAIIKPFMNKELLNMLHLHHPGEDMNKFFQNCIPKECMPSDYGGSSLSSEEIHKMTIQEFKVNKLFFEMEENQRKQKI